MKEEERWQRQRRLHPHATPLLAEEGYEHHPTGRDFFFLFLYFSTPLSYHPVPTASLSLSFAGSSGGGIGLPPLHWCIGERVGLGGGRRGRMLYEPEGLEGWRRARPFSQVRVEPSAVHLHHPNVFSSSSFYLLFFSFYFRPALSYTPHSITDEKTTQQRQWTIVQTICNNRFFPLFLFLCYRDNHANGYQFENKWWKWGKKLVTMATTAKKKVYLFIFLNFKVPTINLHTRVMRRGQKKNKTPLTTRNKKKNLSTCFFGQWVTTLH